MVHGWTPKARGRTSTTQSFGPSPSRTRSCSASSGRPSTESRWRARTTVTRWGSASSRRSTSPGYGSSSSGSTAPSRGSPVGAWRHRPDGLLAAEVVPARAGREPDGDAPAPRPRRSVLGARGAGRVLRANRQWFASRRAGRAYLGYMERQRTARPAERGWRSASAAAMRPPRTVTTRLPAIAPLSIEMISMEIRTRVDRMTGERGQMRVNRPELIAAHGYDTKYAGQCAPARLPGYRVPGDRTADAAPAEPRASSGLDVRNGRVSFEDVLAEADDLRRRLERLLEGRRSPSVPTTTA